jgi:PAS domain S-box-containing protein
MPVCDDTSDLDAAALLEAAAESILVTTSDLDAPGPSIVYVNRAFETMTGWSRAEVLGRSPRILQGPKTDLRVFADLREKLHSGAIWEGQTINYRKDGSEFWMEWSIVPLRNERGETIQYVAIQRDVSARVEAERRLDRARANLARYFSPKLVETLAAKDEPLGPVRRQDLAVLFADVVGFTALSESLEPEQVMELLRDIHSWMEKVVFKWQGSIEGYIGDAVLAIFGFPQSDGAVATNALSCSYDLLAEADLWNRERAKKGLSPIRIGIGLNYGPVVLGDVGTEDYVEFTVIGDTVNTASRLQQATRSVGCDLVVGQPLVDAVKGETAGDNATRSSRPWARAFCRASRRTSPRRRCWPWVFSRANTATTAGTSFPPTGFARPASPTGRIPSSTISASRAASRSPIGGRKAGSSAPTPGAGFSGIAAITWAGGWRASICTR